MGFYLLQEDGVKILLEDLSGALLLDESGTISYTPQLFLFRRRRRI